MDDFAVTSPGTLLGIFAKYWQPGEVKTRLAATIGAESAARLHRAFVETLLVRMAGVAERCVLAYTPAERRGEFAALVRDAAAKRLAAARGRESISSPPTDLAHPRQPGATKSTPDPFLLEPQSPGDLGARMEHFFHAALAGGAERVVLIGSDSPTLPVGHVRQAFDELRGSEVVLGPSADGGYYLLGIARPAALASPGACRRLDGLPTIFASMPWSTPQVWAETVRRLEEHGHAYAVLPAWYDVDEAADLERLRHELRSGEPDEPLTALAQTVADVLGV